MTLPVPETLVNLPAWAWAGVAVTAAAFVLAMLNTLACLARNEMQIHRLKVETMQLRRIYLNRIRERNGLTSQDVVAVVDEAPADAAPPTRAAA